MSDRVTASFETLMDQATGTADIYLRDAVEAIDRRFGEGYAQKNPSLIGAFVAAASSDYHANVAAKTLSDVAEELSYELKAIGEAIRLNGESIAEGLSDRSS